MLILFYIRSTLVRIGSKYTLANILLVVWIYMNWKSSLPFRTSFLGICIDLESINTNLSIPTQVTRTCNGIIQSLVAICRGDTKVRFLKSLGVDHVVDMSKENVTESVKVFLKARKLKGVDVLYDPVGGKLTKESMKLLNWGAQILVIGFASGEVPVVPVNIALVKVFPLSCVCKKLLINSRS